MKERITITIEKEFLEWLDKKSNLKIFANRSHGFEFLIKSAQLKDEKRKEISKNPSSLKDEGAQ